MTEIVTEAKFEEIVEAELEASVDDVLSNEAMALEYEFEQAVEYDYNNRQRNRENWRQYSGLENSQFNSSEVAQATSEGRYLETYNIITQKVDSLAGAIIKNPFDMDFVPVEAIDSKFTRAVKQASLSDKELMDWEVSYNDLVLAGLIYEGVEEMYIDKRIHPLGNIAFRVNLPGHVIFDPNWKTQSAKDCQKCWRVSYLTAKQIKAIYPHLDGKIDEEIIKAKTAGLDFDPLSKGVTPNFDVLQDVGGTGSKHRVIQCYEMVEEDVWEEYDEMTGLVLPQTDDIAYKKAWLDKRNPKWEASKLKMRQIKKKIQYCTTIIPELLSNTIVQKKQTAIQVGRLQFFPWSAARINGVPRGIVDLIKDIQKNINHREMLISFIIQTEAQGGEILDPLLFNNSQTQIDDYIATKNQTNRTFISAPGALSRGLAPQKLRKAEFPNDVQQQLIRMWDYADRISKSPSAYDARSESGESGYLFAQKIRQAEQQQYVLFAGLKRHLNEKGEAYLEQIKIQYAIGGYEREFSVPSQSDSEAVSFNKKIKTEDGQEVVEFDVSQLPRHKVVVTESPGGLTNRLITRAVSAEILNAVPPDNIGTRTVLVGTIVNSIDTFSEEEKKKLRDFRALEEEQAKETLRFNIKNMKLQQLNAEMQIKQLEQSQSQPVPQAQPGLPIGAPQTPAPQQPEQLPPELATPAQ